MKKKPTFPFWIIFAAFLLVPGVCAADQQVSVKVIGLVQELKFQVLNQHAFKANALSLNILVKKTTTKAQALHIAKRIRETFPGYLLDVGIFDEKEAFQNRLNDRYPEEKFFKHYLVQMNVNPHTGFNEIQWMARGRGK